ncbi:hypothetical protein C8Q76DRAFT_790933 [Earliella scabrosa]|nr:hypothetical protein C8Q76DRAFT_790933 [Earliella scabrosa]
MHRTKKARREASESEPESSPRATRSSPGPQGFLDPFSRGAVPKKSTLFSAGGARLGGGLAAASGLFGGRSGKKPPENADSGKSSSKNTSDKLAEIRSTLASLKHDVEQEQSDRRSMKKRITALEKGVEDVNNALQQETHAREALEGELVTMNERLEAIESYLESTSREAVSRATGEQNENEAEKKRESGKKKRANTLQSAVRSCLYNFMGLESGAALPDPLDKGQYWLTVQHDVGNGNDEDDGKLTRRVLRPDWRRPWSDNKHSWLTNIILRIQSRGTDYQNLLSKDEIAKLSHADIADAVAAVFDGMVRKYTLDHKGDDGKAKKDKATKAKILQRKTKKSESRENVRPRVPRARGRRYDYLFLPAYQSTDESEWEEVPVAIPAAVDPHTDDEAPGASTSGAVAVTRRRVLVAHPGAWRQDSDNEIAAELDAEVAKGRQESEQKGGRGTTHKPRRRGVPRPTDKSELPSMNRRKNKTRIPRSAVNAAWLASEHGKKYDSPKYIAEDDEVVEDENENVGGDEEAEREVASGHSSADD